MNWLKNLFSLPTKEEPQPVLWMSPTYELRTKKGTVYLLCWVQAQQQPQYPYYTLHIKFRNSQYEVVVDAAVLEPIKGILSKLVSHLDVHGADYKRDYTLIQCCESETATDVENGK